MMLCSGGDAGSVWDKVPHSSSLIGMRLLDVAEDRLGRRDAWRPFLCVEGPDELPTWGSVLEDLVDDFARHDPSKGVFNRSALFGGSGCHVVSAPDNALVLLTFMCVRERVHFIICELRSITMTWHV